MSDNFKLRIASVNRPAPEPAPTPADKKRFRFTRKQAMGLAAGILVAALATALLWPKTETTEAASVESDLYTVSGRIMGYVKSVSKNEGDSVRAGEVIANLDTTDFGVEERIKRVKFQKAKRDYDRAASMARGAGISKADLELAELNLSANQADLDATELKLRYTEIQSPVPGRIAKRSIQVGQFIQPGQTLFVVVPEGRAWVSAKFKESQIPRIRTGARATIRVDALPGARLRGHVRAIIPIAASKLSLIPTENSTGNISKVAQRFSVLIDLENPPEGLRPGMSASAEVYVD